MTSNIHIKLEYPEAVSMKKEALLCEQSLLNIVRHIRNYDSLKKKEFVVKNKVKKDLEHLRKFISSLENDLPREEVKEVGEKYKTAEIKQELTRKKTEKSEKKITEKKKMDEIERELFNIKNKLARLD